MSDFPIDVVRSQRRKRTLQASLREGRIKVMVPADLDPAKEEQMVAELVERVTRKLTSDRVDLPHRARLLARRYQLPEPSEVVWSDRQMTRWGSCSPGERRIRISRRLATMPGWVLDSVLVHELAHLEVADHGPAFQRLVGRYALTERAKGYLMAITMTWPDPSVPADRP